MMRGQYSVVVSNFLGVVTSRVATVTVMIPPSITPDPTGKVVVAGNLATLTVVATGPPPLSYQWRKVSGPIAGATNASLIFNPAQTNDWDDYSVAVSNLSGVVTSPSVTLVVYQPVNIAVLTSEQAGILTSRASTTFSVRASGFPAPVYQWSFKGTNILGAGSSNLTIFAVHLNDLGSYAVQVSNAYSSVLSSSVTLDDVAQHHHTFYRCDGYLGREGAALNVVALGSGTITYQWYKDGVPDLRGQCCDLSDSHFAIHQQRIIYGGGFQRIRQCDQHARPTRGQSGGSFAGDVCWHHHPRCRGLHI